MRSITLYLLEAITPPQRMQKPKLLPPIQIKNILPIEVTQMARKSPQFAEHVNDQMKALQNQALLQKMKPTVRY